MARKNKKATEAETPESSAAIAFPATDAPDDGPIEEGKFIAVDVGGGGAYEIHKVAPGDTGKERTIRLMGRTYEHVGEHRGVWAYRYLG